jgi:hypothetical protein
MISPTNSTLRNIVENENHDFGLGCQSIFFECIAVISIKYGEWNINLMNRGQALHYMDHIGNSQAIVLWLVYPRKRPPFSEVHVISAR